MLSQRRGWIACSKRLTRPMSPSPEMGLWISNSWISSSTELSPWRKVASFLLAVAWQFGSANISSSSSTNPAHVTSCASKRMERSEEHTSELQSRQYLVCRLLLEKKKKHKHGLAKRKRYTIIRSRGAHRRSRGHNRDVCRSPRDDIHEYVSVDMRARQHHVQNNNI